MGDAFQKGLIRGNPKRDCGKPICLIEADPHLKGNLQDKGIRDRDSRKKGIPLLRKLRNGDILYSIHVNTFQDLGRKSMNQEFFSNKTVMANESRVSGQGGCPICRGELIPYGRETRCVRCGFSVCEGCGSGFGENLEIFSAVAGKIS
jgi:hypothetical protein